MKSRKRKTSIFRQLGWTTAPEPPPERDPAGLADTLILPEPDGRRWGMVVAAAVGLALVVLMVVGFQMVSGPSGAPGGNVRPTGEIRGSQPARTATAAPSRMDDTGEGSTAPTGALRVVQTVPVTVTETVRVPGPTQTIMRTVPTPVPGPTVTVTKPVPTPVPGPTVTVTKTVQVTVTASPSLELPFP